HAGAAEFDPEAGGLERALEELRALDLLHAGLAEEEDRVTDRRHLRSVAIDRVERELLALVGGVSRERHQEAECSQQSGGCLWSHGSPLSSDTIAGEPRDFRPNRSAGPA